MNSALPSRDTVAFVLKGYPRLSESFIAQEIYALEQRGLNMVIVSLRHPTDPATHTIHEMICAKVHYLPEYLYQEPLRVLRAWRTAWDLPGYAAAWKLWQSDLRLDRTANRVRRFGQALVLSHDLKGMIRHIHAHFLHTPASVARYASVLLGIPWSCSAHAKDIWTTPLWEKKQKLTDCEWITTCTQANAEHLRGCADDPQKIKLNYHGVDLCRFPPPDRRHVVRDGRNSGDPTLILSVGRAVDKKGYDDLLHALARLPSSRHWQFVHIGNGEELPALKRLAQKLGCASRVRWLGALPHRDVLNWYRRADVFALACRVTANGDRDGLPNVLLEALSQGLAVVSTNISGIPELIEHNEHGLLVPEREISALSQALDRLITDPHLRQQLGEAGCMRVRRNFALDSNIDGIAVLFGIRQVSAA